MKRISWIALSISVALILAGCGSTAEETPSVPEVVQEAPASVEADEPTVEAAALPDDSPGAIFMAAMAGVQTDVKPFLEGIPVPEDGSVSMEDSDRMDFITSMTIEACAQFYRDTFPALGLVEIEELSIESDFGATLIFGGYPDGKAIRVKVSNLSQISRNIKIHILDPTDL